MKSKSKQSSVIDREESHVLPGLKGQKPYRVDQIYQWLYDNSDSRGIVIYRQKEIAQLIDISYQSVCTILQGLVQIGFLKKHGQRFEVVYDPDDVVWTDDIRIRLHEIRREIDLSAHKKRRKE